MNQEHSKGCCVEGQWQATNGKYQSIEGTVWVQLQWLREPNRQQMYRGIRKRTKTETYPYTFKWLSSSERLVSTGLVGFLHCQIYEKWGSEKLS